MTEECLYFIYILVFTWRCFAMTCVSKEMFLCGFKSLKQSSLCKFETASTGNNNCFSKQEIARSDGGGCR